MAGGGITSGPVLPGGIVSIGQRFGYLTVIGPDVSDRRRRWACLCDCGNERSVRHDALIAGSTLSCAQKGCRRSAVSGAKRSRHGHSRSAEYPCWCGMLYRCENPKAPNYKRYGGRGITVCERWHTFSHFLADMGPRPSRDHSIDRVDNDRGYEPGNCVWALPRQQAANTSKTVKVIVGGETVSLNEAWKRLGLPNHRTLYAYKAREGCTPQEAVDHFARAA